MGLKLLTDAGLIDIVSGVGFSPTRAYYIVSDVDEGDDLQTTLTYLDDTTGAEETEVAMRSRFTIIDDNHYYTSSSNMLVKVDVGPVPHLTWETIYTDSFTDPQKAWIALALDRWSEIILEDRTIQLTVSYPPTENQSPSEMLAAAGPTTTDNDRFLPTAAILQIDPMDLDGNGEDMDGNIVLVDDNGDTVTTELYYTVLHEIGHALGIGTLWNVPPLGAVGPPAEIIQSRELLFNGNTGSPIYNVVSDWEAENPIYKGTHGVAAYNEIVGDLLGQVVDFLPVEDNGGDGTAGLHPEESLLPRSFGTVYLPGLDSELMTGYLNRAVHAPLSIISVGMLKDLGWTVDASKADEFIFPTTLPTPAPTPTPEGPTTIEFDLDPYASLPLDHDNGQLYPDKTYAYNWPPVVPGIFLSYVVSSSWFHNTISGMITSARPFFGVKITGPHAYWHYSVTPRQKEQGATEDNFRSWDSDGKQYITDSDWHDDAWPWTMHPDGDNRHVFAHSPTNIFWGLNYLTAFSANALYQGPLTIKAWATDENHNQLGNSVEATFSCEFPRYFKYVEICPLCTEPWLTSPRTIYFKEDPDFTQLLDGSPNPTGTAIEFYSLEAGYRPAINSGKSETHYGGCFKYEDVFVPNDIDLSNNLIMSAWQVANSNVLHLPDGTINPNATINGGAFHATQQECEAAGCPAGQVCPTPTPTPTPGPTPTPTPTGFHTASTATTTTSYANTKIVQVASTVGFHKGNYIVLGFGTSKQEYNVIASIGSLILETELIYDHDPGTIITSILEMPTPTPSPTTDFYMSEPNGWFRVHLDNLTGVDQWDGPDYKDQLMDAFNYWDETIKTWPAFLTAMYPNGLPNAEDSQETTGINPRSYIPADWPDAIDIFVTYEPAGYVPSGDVALPSQTMARGAWSRVCCSQLQSSGQYDGEWKREFGETFAYEGTIRVNETFFTNGDFATLSNIDTRSSFYHTIRHEICHVLGLNSSMFIHGVAINVPVVSYVDADDGHTKYYYNGANGLAEYKSYFPAYADNFVGIPLEDGAGGGATSGGHFEEGDNVNSPDNRYINGHLHPGLEDEMMTGWSPADNTVDTYVSRITLGVLTDIGWDIDMAKAEPFSRDDYPMPTPTPTTPPTPTPTPIPTPTPTPTSGYVIDIPDACNGNCDVIHLTTVENLSDYGQSLAGDYALSADKIIRSSELYFTASDTYETYSQPVHYYSREVGDYTYIIIQVPVMTEVDGSGQITRTGYIWQMWRTKPSVVNHTDQWIGSASDDTNDPICITDIPHVGSRQQQMALSQTKDENGSSEASYCNFGCGPAPTPTPIPAGMEKLCVSGSSYSQVNGEYEISTDLDSCGRHYWHKTDAFLWWPCGGGYTQFVIGPDLQNTDNMTWEWSPSTSDGQFVWPGDFDWSSYGLTVTWGECPTPTPTPTPSPSPTPFEAPDGFWMNAVGDDPSFTGAWWKHDGEATFGDGESCIYYENPAIPPENNYYVMRYSTASSRWEYGVKPTDSSYYFNYSRSSLWGEWDQGGWIWAEFEVLPTTAARPTPTPTPTPESVPVLSYDSAKLHNFYDYYADLAMPNFQLTNVPQSILDIASNGNLSCEISVIRKSYTGELINLNQNGYDSINTFALESYLQDTNYNSFFAGHLVDGDANGIEIYNGFMRMDGSDSFFTWLGSDTEVELGFMLYHFDYNNQPESLWEFRGDLTFDFPTPTPTPIIYPSTVYVVLLSSWMGSSDADGEYTYKGWAYFSSTIATNEYYENANGWKLVIGSSFNQIEKDNMSYASTENTKLFASDFANWWGQLIVCESTPCIAPTPTPTPSPSPIVGTGWYITAGKDGNSAYSGLYEGPIAGNSGSDTRFQKSDGKTLEYGAWSSSSDCENGWCVWTLHSSPGAYYINPYNGPKCSPDQGWNYDNMCCGGSGGEVWYSAEWISDDGTPRPDDMPGQGCSTPCDPTDSVCVSGFPNQGSLVFNGEYTYNAGPGIDDDTLNTGKPYWSLDGGYGDIRLYYMTPEMASGQTNTTGNYWYFTWTAASALIPVHSSLDNEGADYPWEADWQGNGTVECGSC